MPAGGFAGPPAIEIDTHCEGRRWWFGDANLQRYSSEIAACCKVASNTSRRGAVGVHGFQVLPRPALFGSPVRMTKLRNGYRPSLLRPVFRPFPTFTTCGLHGNVTDLTSITASESVMGCHCAPPKATLIKSSTGTLNALTST